MGKKIDQLDPYGSPVSSKRAADLIEVSKNSGTPSVPIYAPGDSKKLRFDELQDALGGIPYSGINYEVVKNNGTDAITNGAALMSALDLCYSKTPNGLALSTINRATLYLLSGNYDVGSSTIELSQFVDIVSFGGSGRVNITSNNSITITIDSTNDYQLSGLTISNSGSGIAIGNSSVYTDNGIWFDIVFNSSTSEVLWAGHYDNINSTVDSVMMGSISGTVKNSSFKNMSCGYSAVGASDISGHVDNCTGLNYCFCFSFVDRARISGTVKNSIGGQYCFASTESISGSSGEVSGIVDHCHGTNNCFGSATSASSFGIISGLVINSSALANSFGYSPNLVNGYISGKLINSICNAINSCGFTQNSGEIISFTGFNSRGLHSGVIERCCFINPSGNIVDTIELSDNSIIRYSTIIQMEPTKDSININSGASVKILHCESNVGFNLISGNHYTNLVYLPRNVIWGEKGEVFVSEIADPVDGFYHKFRKYADSSGDLQTEDLGPV